MDARKLTKLRTDLTSFLDEVVGTMGHPRRRRWCDAYLRGVLLDGHRKSVEPTAARLRAIEQGDQDYEQAFQQFLSQSPWDQQELLDGLHPWIGRRFGTDGFLIIDDTGFPKQGEHSVGVARQYTGTLGKVASCQVAVTLQFATADHVVALDARLYLPEAWTEDRERLTTAGVPDTVEYQPKWEMALAMVRRAVANGLTGSVTWREGSKGKMVGRFAAWRVRPAHKLSAGKTPLAACRLLVEWPDDAAHPEKYFFSNLPAETSLKRLVATAKTRWWVEMYQADCTSSRRWVGTGRIGYHRRDGVARVGRVVPAAPGGSRRRNCMSDTTRRPAPPRA